MAGFKVKLIGKVNLQKKLNSMAKASVKKAVLSAAASGASVTAEKANQRAPGPHIIFEPDSEETRPGRAAYNVGPDKEHWYYCFFETGTAPHEIKPRRKGKKLALSWGGNVGGEAYVHVFHPGFPAQPFLRPAITDNTSQIVNAMGGGFLAGLGIDGGDLPAVVRAIKRAVATGAAEDAAVDVAGDVIGV